MSRSWKVWALCLSACLFSLTGCGGGGGGGGGPALQGNTVVLGGLSGEIDPDGDGTALVSFTLFSPFDTQVDISVEFSVDGGDTFQPATEDRVKPTGGGGHTSEGIHDLAAGPGGIQHWFAWDTDAPADLPGQNVNWVLLRIRVLGGGSVTSGWLTVTNDPDDALTPGVEKITAKAKEGPLNDVVTVVFDEPVDAQDAVDPAYFRLFNPVGQERQIPPGSTFTYDPMNRKTRILLDSGNGVNLQYGTECTIQVTGIHDLAGNAVSAGDRDGGACTVGGDGAQVPEDLPKLVLAYFTGSGAAPAPGDTLHLVFDEAMAVSDTAGFGDPDVLFWDPGDSLGDEAQLSVVLEGEKEVSVTLGTNVFFTPGVSKINLSPQNDVITDLAGNKPYLPDPAGPEDYETIIAEETEPPVVDLLTLNQIPDILNGKGPAGGRLLGKRSGFTIDLEYHDPGGAGVDPSSIEIQCLQDVTWKGNPLSAGENLVPHLVLKSADEAGASFKVPGTLVFPEGFVTIKGRVRDRMDNLSVWRKITFQALDPTPELRPFETSANPSQVWSLVYTRDLYTISIAGSDTITVSCLMVPDGTADFNEDLLLFGLRSENPVQIPGLSCNSNEFLYDLVLAAVRNELETKIFPGVNIAFTEQHLGALPGNAPQVPYDDFDHSLIAIGGASDVGALGVAFIDRGNENQDNDVLYKGSSPYNPGVNLGIFTTEIFMAEVNAWSNGLFRLTFDPFIPGRGVPVGEGADDTAILMDLGGVGPPVSGDAAVRRDAIVTAVDRLGRYIAVVTGHEMGHSMGLAVDGAMPNGLYGGDPEHFPGSNTNHINLSSFVYLFSYPDINIMTPYTTFTRTNGEGTRFNRLNLAFLRERVFYHP